MTLRQFVNKFLLRCDTPAVRVLVGAAVLTLTLAITTVVASPQKASADVGGLTYNCVNNGYPCRGHVATYKCSAGFTTATNDAAIQSWSSGGYFYEMWVFALNGQETSAAAAGSNDLWGLQISSTNCASGNPIQTPCTNLPGNSENTPQGDNICPDLGQMAEGTNGGNPPFPNPNAHATGMVLGQQNMGPDNNQGKVMKQIGGAATPDDRPPVFQYNWETGAVILHSGGAFDICTGGTLTNCPVNGNTLVYCQALVQGTTFGDPTTYGNASCPGDVTTFPRGSGSGWMQSSANCGIDNGTQSQPPAPVPPGSYDPIPPTPGGYTCATPGIYSWMRTNSDLGNTVIGRNPATGELNRFSAHQYARATDVNPNVAPFGFGSRTYVQVQYPIMKFDFTPTCSGLDYTVTDPLYPSYPAALPQLTFFFNGGNQATASGLSGHVDLPAGMSGTIQVVGQTTLDGVFFQPVHNTPNCPPAVNYACGDENLRNGMPIGVPIKIQPYFIITGVSPPPSRPNYQIDVGAVGDPNPVTGLIALQTDVPYSYDTGNSIAIVSPPLSIGTLPPTDVGRRISITWDLYSGSGRTAASLLKHCEFGHDDDGPTNTPHFHPYMKVYGGDVSAGEGFADGAGTCTTETDSQGIFGNQRNGDNGVEDGGPTYEGAGTQFGAQAVGDIHGFVSAQGFNTDPRRLSFANTIAPSNNSFGGDFLATPGGSTLGDPGISCATDFYGTGTPGLTPQVSSTLNAVGAGSTAILVVPPAGLSVATGGTMTIAKSQQATVYVKGDVYIANNIMYDPANWSINNIPQFKLVVQGNIYVDSNVTQLDGLYVAEPNGATGGTIYDCASSFQQKHGLDSSFYTDCNTQLVINGAFVANQVQFMRTFGDWGVASDGNEKYQAGLCLQAATCTGSRGGEVFNYSPELWVPTPQASGTPAAGKKYDSITSLPPVL